MLQAFATTKVLEARGIDYELIRYKKNLTIIEKIKSIPRLFNGILLNDKYEALKKKIGIKKHPEFAVNDAIRMKAFKTFSEKYFKKLSPEFVGYAELCKGATRYSAVVTGSDQLWSPAGLATNFYNLMFVPDNIRKISYASSFGVKQIPWYQIKRTRAYLNRIEFISMRENRGSEIVYELTNKKVPTILDPVFSFDQRGWQALLPPRKIISEPYIFAYFLGGIAEHREQVRKLSETSGLKVVALRHLDQYIEQDDSFGDYAPYNVGPEDFLNLIRGAEFVCTDSFHGACFSIIHHKKFMVFDRYSDVSKTSKNSRIDSLCTNFNLSNRRFSGEVLKITENIDYEEVDKLMTKMKKDTDEYLDKAFSGII